MLKAPESVGDLKDLFKSLKDMDVDNNFNWDNKVPSLKATFHDDPLALSCASYRIYKESPVRRFTGIDLVKATAEDRVHAQAIRDHYNSVYTMKALKGFVLTEYQQKTAQFLSGLYHLNNDELGLLYKLPYFYEEDRALEKIASETVSWPNRGKTPPEHGQYELTPFAEVFRSRKRDESVQFYYKDQENHPVLIQCRAGDPLLPMLRGLFSQPKIRVQGFAVGVSLDNDNNHIAKKLNGWELVF